MRGSCEFKIGEGGTEEGEGREGSEAGDEGYELEPVIEQVERGGGKSSATTIRLHSIMGSLRAFGWLRRSAQVIWKRKPKLPSTPVVTFSVARGGLWLSSSSVSMKRCSRTVRDWRAEDQKGCNRVSRL